MSKADEQFQQVSDLVVDAFDNLAKAEGLPTGRAAHNLEARATLQMAAANTLAVMTLSQEVRAVGLLLASSSPIGPSVEVAREAFVAASTHLGLVEEEPPMTQEEYDAMIRNLGADPADTDVES